MAILCHIDVEKLYEIKRVHSLYIKDSISPMFNFCLVVFNGKYYRLHIIDTSRSKITRCWTQYERYKAKTVQTMNSQKKLTARP